MKPEPDKADQEERFHFHIEVGVEATLTIEEIWPDGDAPESPTDEDVIAQIVASTSAYRFARDWGFEQHVSVNGKPVDFRRKDTPNAKS